MFFKGEHRPLIGGLELAPGPGVEGNEIHLGLEPVEDADELPHVLGRIVHPPDQDIFNGDPPAVGELVGAQRLHEVRQGVLPGDRHDALSDGIIRGVERNGKGRLGVL